MTEQIFVFLGPSLDRQDAAAIFPQATFLPPAAQGDLLSLVSQHPAAICLIDGIFRQAPSVWHKEVLWALSKGIPVIGGSSMGALRAAELHEFGMQGIGEIFEAFRDGTLEDDDEVAVAHADAERAYRPASEAMVDIRATFAAAARLGIISDPTARRLTAVAKKLFFPDRQYETVIEDASADTPADAGELERLRAWLPEGRVRQKRCDAIRVLEFIRSGAYRAYPPRPFAFQHTTFFQQAQQRVRAVRSGALADDPRDHVLNELRLDPAGYQAVRRAACTRMLAAWEAATAPGQEPALQSLSEEYRRERGLLEPAATEEWMANNDLSLEGFARLLAEEAALRAFLAKYGKNIDDYLMDELCASGAYARLSSRAAERAAELDELSPPVPDQTVLAWYFGRHLSRPTPRNLEEYALSLGYSSSQALLDNIERLYRREGVTAS
jgi:hypothetical protein